MRPDIHYLSGIKVTIAPDVPRRHLSPRVCEVLASDFIKETNAWLRAFFGTTNALYDGEVRWLSDKSIVVNPRTWEAMKQTLRVIQERNPR